MLTPNIENFIGCDAGYEEADIVLYGAPFDSTTSFRPGARFGPAAMRHESFGLETYSPYQDRDLMDAKVFDSGDLELCFGSSEMALQDIEARAAEILQDGKLPLLLGGEHLVTLGAVRAVAAKYPELEIIHFDAHADLRDDYLGAHLSHACVLRRCHDLLGDGRIHQFCIRSGEREEFRFAAEHTDMHRFDFTGLSELVEKLQERETPVYLTIDLDCLDPSAFPGTGTPEAGGVSFLQLLEAIRTATKANIVAADVNELAPMLDVSGRFEVPKLKALLEQFEVRNIETALFLTEHLADYVLTPDLSSPQETAIDHLRFMTDDHSAELLLSHVNLYAYGCDLIKEDNATLSPYGLLHRADYQPMLSPMQETQKMEMKMK